MTVTVQIQMDEQLRDKAARNLASNGLTIDEAMRIVPGPGSRRTRL